MLQFVRVNYESSRDVFVDGVQNGQTNKIIRVDEATFEFDLGTPRDYTPDNIVEQVTGTTSINPLELNFKPKSAGD